jgi:type IV secretion system protein VirB10
LDAVLVNKLVSDNYMAPVMAMVDRPYYDPLTQKLLVPAGTRILGKAEAVKYQTASRLAITFETFQFPNGTTFTIKPDEQALEGLGIFGLQDHVNRHTARILFTAGLVGILTGWNASKVQGGAGASAAYDGTDLMRIQANNSMSKTAEQMLSPFLNAVPTITVDEGHRLKVWISRDIPMDAYREAPNE